MKYLTLLIPLLIAATANVFAAEEFKGQQIEQESVKGEFVDVGGKQVWRETIKYRNTTKKDFVDVTATSQPYSDTKAQPGNPGSGKTGQKLEKKITVKAGETVTVTFDHTPLPNGEKYKSWYTDIYESEEERKLRIGPWVGLGNYAFTQVRPNQGGLIQDSLNYPYPGALRALEVGTTTFFLAVSELELPAGWTFEGVSPSSFTLEPDGSILISAAFQLPDVTQPGDIALIEVDIGYQDKFFSSFYLGVVVPDSGQTLSLTALALLLLIPIRKSLNLEPLVENEK